MIINSKKAILPVCLFLYVSIPVFPQEFSFGPASRAAYDRILHLESVTVREVTENVPADDLYVQALSETFELLLSEDAEKFSVYEAAFEKRVDRKNSSLANDLFVKAEMHLQWVFVYLKFGHEFDAAIQLRKAYLTTRDLRKKFPAYKAALKTSGLLNVMIGSVPDKYNWVLNVLDMRGDVSQGLKELETLKSSNHDLAPEANLWHAFILGFVLQQPDDAVVELTNAAGTPENLTAKFLAANLHVKNSESEKALILISDIERAIAPESFPYLSYLKGEILLQKGAYPESIKSFEAFLLHYKGQNYLKDAHYKMGICYWVMNRVDAATREFDIAKGKGRETTEADRYASRALLADQPPPVALVKLRYFTDGGYYSSALEIVQSIGGNKFSEKRDEVEFHYRRARLYHKMNDLPRAIHLYKLTIESNGNSEWYFAPNACLQLGYIAVEEKRFKEARDFFTKALSYKNHAYKNSIDSKARSALAQLRERR